MFAPGTWPISCSACSAFCSPVYIHEYLICGKAISTVCYVPLSAAIFRISWASFFLALVELLIRRCCLATLSLFLAVHAYIFLEEIRPYLFKKLPQQALLCLLLLNPPVSQEENVILVFSIFQFHAAIRVLNSALFTSFLCPKVC